MKNNVLIIIPAYQPGPSLVDLVKFLYDSGFYRILIVNDGSDKDKNSIFDLCSKVGAEVLSHQKNRGKGEALKTAFRHCLMLDKPPLGVITCDADGQHLIKDIIKVKDCFLSHPDSVVLGARFCDKQKIPMRSRVGNEITKIVFQILIGRKLQDTQTGLRAIPFSLLRPLVDLKTSRYEFELDMLIVAHQKKIQAKEVPISTVYENGNESSHFNPVLDSLRVYYVFFRFILASGLSAIIDTTVFFTVQILTGQLFVSMLAARLTAGLVNFYVNRKFTFKSRGSIFKEFIFYWALIGFYLLVTYSVVKLLTENWGMNVYLAKISTEGLVFVFSFLMQRSIVFDGGLTQNDQQLSTGLADEGIALNAENIE